MNKVVSLSKEAMQFLSQLPVVVVTVEGERIIDIRLVDQSFIAALALLAKVEKQEDGGEK